MGVPPFWKGTVTHHVFIADNLRVLSLLQVPGVWSCLLMWKHGSPALWGERDKCSVLRPLSTCSSLDAGSVQVLSLALKTPQWMVSFHPHRTDVLGVDRTEAGNPPRLVAFRVFQFCFGFLFVFWFCFYVPLSSLPSIIRHVLFNVMQWTYTKIHLVSAT